MDRVSPVIGAIMEYTIEPMGRQLSYLFLIRKNIQNLKSRVEMLDTKESVYHKVCEATRNTENIESVVQNWFTKADSINEKSEITDYTIGVYGMGVKPQIQKEFQGQLGDKLGLKFDQETEEGRALMLQKRLKMEQRMLVVLDDIWKQIDSETIGIPSIERPERMQDPIYF
ncbi:unnamed protein product [Citrullus colocynthis]|uniref:NB-ARC domain-containing protein n=1 Tax=Citrullus colocynthis TaxID=252529 RepID=A0ABP0YZP6_9ROSI